MKRFLTVLALILLIALALTGCEAHIADTNGPDDITPVTLTDEDIIFKFSSVCLTYSQLNIENKTKVRCRKMSGIQIINRITDETKSEMLTYTASVSNGNLRICLVDLENDRISADLTLDGATHTLMLSDLEFSSSSSVWNLVAAGESASFTLDYTLIP